MQPQQASARTFQYEGRTIEVQLNEPVRLDNWLAVRPLARTDTHPTDPAQDKFECEIVYPVLPKDLINMGIKDPDEKKYLTGRELAAGIVKLHRMSGM